MQSQSYAVGDLIAGSYRVLRVFGGAGASGMGVVYLVDERDWPEPFVLKACQDGNTELRSRFKQEANVWVSLGGHPHIAKALWVRHLDEQLFVAAEYVDGAEGGFGSLQDVVGTSITLRQVLRWSMQFCSGLAHAIARGLVAHRDIKPANLLLTRHGDLKIADFGLGKWNPLEAAGPHRLETASTGVSGTPPYMAPEQVSGGATDRRCDIYAFGIVLYQLCSGGAYPYEIARPRTAPSYADAHLHGNVRPLSSPFWPIIRRCLERSAQDRWQSPENLADAIHNTAAEIGLPCPPLVPLQPADLSELYSKAQSLTALGRPKEALDAIELHLSMSPEAFWAWTEKGRILIELERNADAESATRQSLALDSTNSQAWNNLGLILRRLGRIEESRGAFDRALECDPLNGGARMNAALTFFDLGHHGQSAEMLCAALRLTPKKKALRFNAGNMVGLMTSAGSLDPAEKIARELIATDAADGQAWHNLGVLLIGRGNRKEGLDCVRTAAKWEPANADSRLFLAKLSAEEGLLDEANLHLDYLITSGQQEENAICLKAQLFAHGHGIDEGIALLENFLKRSRNSDRAWFILCRLAQSKGKFDLALRAAQECEAILSLRKAPANRENLRWARSTVRELRARLGK